MLLVIVVWMLYDLYPIHSRASVTSLSVLELMWISAHSTTFQDLMKMSGNSTPDQLRLKGMKAEVCLADLVSQPARSPKHEDNNCQPDLTAYAPNWQEFVSEGFYPQLHTRQPTNQY